MLRVLLDAFRELEIQDHPLSFISGARWYSEPRLLSPFRPRLRPDPLGEGFTNADAVIGHFEFHETSRAGLRLLSDARQFVVIEAKMFSDLSAGTTNARAYNQAARNVACMAEAVARSGQSLSAIERLGFFVIAPAVGQRRPTQKLLDTAVEREAIRRSVRERVASYGAAQRLEAAEFETWERDCFTPFLDLIASTGGLSVLSWEDCIETVRIAAPECGAELLSFYRSCLELGALVPGRPSSSP
jgi:hypothetical protein